MPTIVRGRPPVAPPPQRQGAPLVRPQSQLPPSRMVGHNPLSGQSSHELHDTPPTLPQHVTYSHLDPQIWQEEGSTSHFYCTDQFDLPFYICCTKSCQIYAKKAPFTLKTFDILSIL